jgi:hypothetical protein
MATPAFPINETITQQAILEVPLRGDADWEELIAMVHDANELVRLARALIPVDSAR